MRAGAVVTVVSPNIDQQLKTWVDENSCHWIQNFYSSDLLSNEYVQLWATTNNPTINHQIYKDAKKFGILVNVVDDQPYCDFITPSIINRGKIQIAISSGGASPVLVRKIRQTFESLLAQNTSLLADFVCSKRNAIKEQFATVTERKRFWESFFDNEFVNASNKREDLEALYQSLIEKKQQESGSLIWIEYDHDVELLTIKALQQMQKVELVYHTEDCPLELMDLVRRDANRQAFKDAVELASLLDRESNEVQRRCVLVPSGSNEFNLLIGKSKLYKLGQVL